jgi:tRNA(His) 5'-end guanylyltransferase
MTITSLREKIKSYEEAADIKLLQKLPIVIIVNGRSFKKATSLLRKPFSHEFMGLMGAVSIKLCQEIDGSIFSYSFNDEVVLIARNDFSLATEPFCDNRAQKISSTAASIATLEINRAAKQNNTELFGDVIFTAKTFVVPNINEAISVLISKQQQSFHTSLYVAAFYELLNKYDLNTVQNMLIGKTVQEKIDLLYNETSIRFDEYPTSFVRGFACYRSPKIFHLPDGDIVKNKLSIDLDIPIFSKDYEFLSGILTSGKGILKAE